MMRRRKTLPLRRIRHALSVPVLTVLLMAAGIDPAEAKRLALVVGNSQYDSIPDLSNAARDAADVADALKRLGFEVTLLTDVKTDELWEKVDAFSLEAETAESTVFYYSGHAFQMSGVNYLVPVDARLTSREDIRSQTWNLDGVIAQLQDRKRTTLIFLDACRNDPLPQEVRGTGAQADGLARLQTGVGTFVAFATEPGGVSYDGTGDSGNSPFTSAILRNIESPGLSVSDMMIKVRNDVEEATGRLQTPWDQSSLREQFYFKPAEEAKQELSEADYELLAQLSPDDRKKFLDLLRQSGFSEASLRQADDAITVASLNLELAADAGVTIGVAAPVVAAVDPAPEAAPETFEFEVVDGGVQVGGVGDAVAAAAPEPAPEQVAAVEPEPAPVPEQVAAVEPEPAPAPEQVAAVEPEPAPEQVAAVAPEPAPAQVAAVEPEPAPVPEQVAAVEPAPAPEVIATIPETDVALLPTSPDPLGLTNPEPDLEPIRLAALTWETRGISGIDAATGDRIRVEGSEITPDSDENRAILAAIDPTLLDDSGISEMTEKDLALAVQGELKRLGCYLLRVDGSWGRGSRTALTSYFLAKKQVPESLEPSVELLQLLKADTKVVCEVRVARVAKQPGLEKAIAESNVGKTNPKTGRVVNAPAVVKKEIKKGLLNPGSF